MATTIDLLEKAAEMVLETEQAADFKEALTRVGSIEIDGIRVCTMEQVKSVLAGHSYFTDQVFAKLLKSTGTLFTIRHTRAMQEFNHRMAMQRVNPGTGQSDSLAVESLDSVLAEEVLNAHIQSQQPSAPGTAFSWRAFIGSTAREALKSIFPSIS